MDEDGMLSGHGKNMAQGSHRTTEPRFLRMTRPTPRQIPTLMLIVHSFRRLIMMTYFHSRPLVGFIKTFEKKT